MKNSALLGVGRFTIPLPRILWQNLITRGAQKMEEFLRDFWSEEYRHFYDFVVRELPREGKPLSPEFIGQQLNMPVDRVNVILDTLEQEALGLFREGQEVVVWAYPVTAARTPHYLTFSTGEKVYAA
jgi:hypothetical protein